MKVFILLPLIFSKALAHTQTRAQCRCIYGQKCWPSTSDFSALASNLSQPLVYPVPTASACYPVSSPSGNCTDIQENQSTLQWRTDRAGSMILANFEDLIFSNGTISACYVNTSLGFPCEQGNVPVIGVDARSVADIQYAVKFVATHNLRVVIKNTGHDYCGRSAGRGAFQIWTHHLKDITYNAAFVPKGAPETETYNAITLGAGVQWSEAHKAINTYGRVLVGGLAGTVGAAGGWLLGGGHSFLSPRYGLGVDNVIEFNIVTSTGSYITANSYRNSDLFWALCGGGGGTFGVVTSVTYQTHPSVPLTGTIISSTSLSPLTIKKLLTEFIRIHPSLSDAGFSGYGSSSNTSAEFTYFAFNTSDAAVNQIMKPFFTYAQNLTSEGLNITQMGTASYESFYAFYEPFSVSMPTGVVSITELASRLIPRSIFEDDYQKLADTFFNLNSGISWNLVAGGAVSKVDPDSTGLNPSWRKALVHAAFCSGWAEGTPASDIAKIRAQCTSDLKKVSDLMPDAGSYFNEGSLYETNPQEVYFGSHYSKLKAIKNVYDPIGLFVVAEGVGSEDWDKDLICPR